jgi:N-acetylglucosaminyldiphosphoundecaprenol N-acetyl-beta-D-mannosaminyltransferase
MTSSSFIFNTRVDNLAKRDIFRIVDTFSESEQFHQIATINPEFLLLARKNAAFQTVLNRCELNVADGVGIHFALWRQGRYLRARVTGVDLMAYILQQAERNHLTVMCVLRKDGLSKWNDVRRALKEQYPKLAADGIDIRHDISIDMLRAETQQCISDAYIVLCNFGAPYQELFLAGLRNHQGTIRVAIGVGGSFDFMTGKMMRSPRWMRTVGLEWLWRLSMQPWRFKRIWNAVIVFPVRVLLGIK